MRMDQFKSYFTISALAKELDVKKSHIRLCEDIGLISPRPSKLKRRKYNRYDRERLKLAFHFLHQGYSKKQIIDLIGIPDVNLDENEQLVQGIKYTLKMLKKLERRKEELSFTKQTRTIEEIEMLREYINKIKDIKSDVLAEPMAEPSIRLEEKAKIPSQPVMAVPEEAEKKTIQHPVKVIFLFVVGLALVILIGGYFYYQTGKKEMDHITPEEDNRQQKNELSRLKSFLNEYCQTYTNKDLDKFTTFFTPDATENKKSFHELLPDHRKNLEAMESLTYRIELVSYSKQNASENLIIRGRFFIRYQLEKGIWEENNGSIFMELLEHEDSFLVKRLTY